MARRLTRREWTLVLTLGIVGLAMLYFQQDPRLGRVGASSAKEEAARLGDPPVVHLDRLALAVEGYDPEGRNLFGYWVPPPPKAAPPPRVERPVAPPPPVTTAQVAPPPPRVPPKPTPPQIGFRYLGFLGPKEAKIAVFEDGKELLLARAGEVVKNQFRLVDFGYESVVMGYVDDRFKDQTTELRQTQTTSRRR